MGTGDEFGEGDRLGKVGFWGVRWVGDGDGFAPITSNSVLAGALPQIPLRQVTAIPQTPSCI